MRRNACLPRCLTTTAALLLGNLPTHGEIILHLDPTSLPLGHSLAGLEARFHSGESVQAEVSWGGVPFLYHFALPCPSSGTTWVDELVLSYECGESFREHSLTPVPGSMPCSGGQGGDYGQIAFDTDPQYDCFATVYIVDDLRIQFVGNTLVLDWTHPWCIHQYHVYRLDHPWQPFEQATLLGFADDNHFELPLEGSSGYFRVTSILCD